MRHEAFQAYPAPLFSVKKNTCRRTLCFSYIRLSGGEEVKNELIKKEKYIYGTIPPMSGIIQT